MSYLFHDEAELQAIASAAVDQAKRAGAQAKAVAESGGGTQISVRDGEAETAVRNGFQTMTITVFQDGRTGSANTATLDKDTISRTVDEALTIASLVQPDPDAGLADPASLAINGPGVALFAPDPGGPAGLLDTAFALEAAASGDDWRVTDAGASSNEGIWALATTQGFCRASRFSFQGRWCSVLAADGETSVQDYHESQDRRVAALEPTEQIARTAIERALSARGARSLSSRRTPVLFEPRVAAMLMGDLTQALSGGPQYSKSTFLPDPLETVIVAEHLSLSEDPFEPFGLASAPFDGEGVAGTRRLIIDRGIAKGLFLASRSARRLGLPSTGNSNGAYNLRLTSANKGGDRTAMLAQLGTGLFVTRILGGATDPVRGGWTHAVAGFWVEGGEIAYPVRDVTLAGTMPQMLRDIVAVGDDVERFGAFRTGSILIGDMQAGGTA